MKTITVAERAGNGDTIAVPVTAGQYMIGVGGTLGGGTVTVKANIGVAKAVPVDGAVYDAPKAEVVWLPNCTVFVTVAGATGASVDVAIAELTSHID